MEPTRFQRELLQNLPDRNTALSIIVFAYVYGLRLIQHLSLSEIQRKDCDSIPGYRRDRPPATTMRPHRRSNTENPFEEGTSAYQSGGFCPVYVGDLFKNRKYRVLNKLGWGEHSTVWLVQDLFNTSPGDDRQFLALKILAAGQHKDGITELIRLGTPPSVDANVSDQGRQYICHLVDHFKHTRPDGTKHVCLALELMGEDMDTFCVNFTPEAIPMPLMRRFTAQLVLALGWAHRLGITHAEIKPAKILVKLQTPSLIVPSYLALVPAPRHDRYEHRSKYTPIRSAPLRNYNPRLIDRNTPDATSEFDICLSGWAARDTDECRRTVCLHPYQSPEVLIGAPWDKQTDWWSLGAALIAIHAHNRLLFRPMAGDTSKKEELRNYLAQMVELCGPFPQSLLRKGNPYLMKDMLTVDGHVLGAMECHTFPPLRSEWWLPGAEQWERAEFAEFLERLMKIDPEERPSSIGELIRYDWLAGSARELVWLSK